MTTDTATTTVTQIYRIYIETTPEKIWEAITDPEWSEKYYYGTRVDYDLNPGGAYRAVPGAPMLAGFEAMGMDAPDVVVDGTVIESDPPRRLVHTWRLLMDPTVESEGFRRGCTERFLTLGQPPVDHVRLQNTGLDILGDLIGLIHAR